MRNICGLIFIATLSCCKTYSVSVNNNLVYTPPPLFTKFNIADVHLRDCVQQSIIDNHVTKAEELKQLNCSNAGIISLDGLNTFYAIEQLNLAENSLQSITPLTNLSQLKVLILRKNKLTSAEPLLHLLQLKEVDISDNEKLACNDLMQVYTNFHKGDLQLTLPAQCNIKH